MPRTHRSLIVASLMLALFMAAMEVTVVSTAMPTVIGDLGGVGLYAWVFAAYMLAATLAMPIFGKVSDLHGRKPVMLFGILLFVLGSAACGQSRSMMMLICLRAVQGFGAGAMQSTSLTIVGDTFQLPARARVQGLMGAVWAVAGILGPLLGGLIVSSLSWRWVFYVNVPFGLVAAVLVVLFLHENVQRVDHSLDWLGGLLLTGGLAALLVSVRGHVAVLPLAALGLGAFVFVERRAQEPVLPLEIFEIRPIAVGCGVGAMAGGALVATLTFVPLFVQGVLGGTPTDAGSTITPMALGWPLASFLTGRLIPAVGYRPLVRLGLLVAATAMAAQAYFVFGRLGIWALRGATALFGVGMGLANTSLIIAVQNSVGWKRRGVATSSMLLSRTIGGAVAVGVLGEILARALGRDPRLETAASLLLARSGRAAGGDTAVRHALGQALGSPLTTIFSVVAGLAVVALAIGLAFPLLRFTPRTGSGAVGPVRSSPPSPPA